MIKVDDCEKKALESNDICPFLDGMDQLIGDGLYESQAEIVKDALRRLFVHYELTCISDAYPIPIDKP